MNISEISKEQIFYDIASSLRHKLFLKEYNLQISVTWEHHEEQSRHFIISVDEDLIAYARLTELHRAEYKISQVVVEPKHQGKGYGKAILKHLIDVAREVGAKSIELNSQVAAKELYRSLGFREVGEVSMVKLTGVPHIRMLLDFSDLAQW